MTQDEEKELELFKDWWNTKGKFIGLEEAIEASWLARAKLDKERNETELL